MLSSLKMFVQLSEQNVGLGDVGLQPSTSELTILVREHQRITTANTRSGIHVDPEKVEDGRQLVCVLATSGIGKNTIDSLREVTAVTLVDRDVDLTQHGENVGVGGGIDVGQSGQNVLPPRISVSSGGKTVLTTKIVDGVDIRQFLIQRVDGDSLVVIVLGDDLDGIDNGAHVSIF